MFVLKARDPIRFRERGQGQHSDTDGRQITISDIIVVRPTIALGDGETPLE